MSLESSSQSASPSDPALSADFAAVATNAIPIWNRNAEFWDGFLGEGNEFQRQLIMPATDNLLAIHPGERVLDIACGNGNYSRHLAEAGAEVVACDAAAAFIQLAQQHAEARKLNITCQVVNATDESALLTLGVGQFDAAVCSMALMDFDPIEPCFRAVAKLLKPNGRFVFSVPHPCFASNGAVRTADYIEHRGHQRHEYGVRVTKYRTSFVDLSPGLLHQPEPHPLFHRSFETLFSAAFAAGLAIDGFVEPAFPAAGRVKNVFSWAKRPEIPPAVVLRARRP